MLTQEHIATAQLEKSDRYFVRLSERGSPPTETIRPENRARRLADEHDDPELAFGVAEKFHANFYHKFMQDYEFDHDRPAVRRFVERIQALLSEG